MNQGKLVFGLTKMVKNGVALEMLVGSLTLTCQSVMKNWFSIRNTLMKSFLTMIIMMLSMLIRRMKFQMNIMERWVFL